jgi:hypothetical protein
MFLHRLDARRIKLAMVARVEQDTGLNSVGEGQTVAGSHNSGFLIIDGVFENAV